MFVQALLLSVFLRSSQSVPAHAYGTPNRQSGLALEQWSQESGMNPEEVGEYLEGDILFPKRPGKNGLIRESARWVNGVVPYEITGKFTNNDRDIIAKAMEQYHKHTCIRFRPKENTDPDWIAVTNTKTGCWSSVGRVGGKQDLNLQSPGCLGKVGTTIHEFLHACGFYHEQNRYDRDSYVDIYWDNIDASKKSNFNKVGNDTTTVYGIEYDYGSVMHYSKYAFSNNGNPTITPTNVPIPFSDVNTKLTITFQESAVIGQREGFSNRDIHKLRSMYNCSDSNVNPVTNGIIDVNQNTNGLSEWISILFP